MDIEGNCRAYTLRRHGRPDVLRLEASPIPTPKTGEVRVRNMFIGLNYAEVLSRKGLYGWAPPTPYIPGMEAYGFIDAVGDDNQETRIGENVIVGAKFGAYSDFMVVPAWQALPEVTYLEPDENAAFAVNYLTAWLGLRHLARLRFGESVLVTAGAGGVGTAALQLALHHGCRVYAGVGSDAKGKQLEALHVDGWVNYRDQDWRQKLRKLTAGHGIDVIIELVGGGVYDGVTPLLNPCGRVVVLGCASLELQRWNPLSWWRAWRGIPRCAIPAMAVRNTGVLAGHLGHLLDDPVAIHCMWRELLAFAGRHQIRPVVGHEFNFDELPKAHELMESRQSTGKIVVRVS